MSNLFSQATDLMGNQDLRDLHQDSEESVRMVPVDEIRESEQVRSDFESEDETLQDLSDSIKKEGLIQPITIRPHPDGNGYEVVAGARRLRATRMAGLGRIMATVRTLTDEQAAAIQMAENIQRKNLSQIEEARQMQKDLDNLDGDLDALAEMYSKSKSWVVRRLALIDLPVATARLIKEKVTADLGLIYDVKVVEKKDPDAAAELVEQLVSASPGVNMREMAKCVKERVSLEARKGQAKKAGKKPVKIVPAKMPRATKKNQPLHTFYANAVSRGLSGRDALELLDVDSREVVLGLFDEVFNRTRAADDPYAEIVQMIREGVLAGAGGVLMVAALEGIKPETDRTPLEFVEIIRGRG
jgi:ParB/RepB/Spo0J family partition protein